MYHSLQVLDWCVPFLRATPMLPDIFLSSLLVCLEQMDLFTVHVLHHRVRLPLLETEAETLMRVVLIVGLILVIFHLDEVTVDGIG